MVWLVLNRKHDMKKRRGLFGDVRKEDDMNDAKKRGRVLGEVGLLMLRRLAGQGFPSHSFHT